MQGVDPHLWCQHLCTGSAVEKCSAQERFEEARVVAQRGLQRACGVSGLAALWPQGVAVFVVAIGKVILEP